MNRLAFCILSAVFMVLSSHYAAAEMVPFVIPVDINPDSEIALDYEPLTEQGRLSAKEHFYTADGQRVRIWGVNLSFGANFPTHTDAARVAKRLAAFGINSVRFHHMDSSTYPRGIWDDSWVKLHPEALDRLDYFIDQLARHGIYSNINLHVGKKFSATLDIPESNTDYDKMVGIFTPELVEAQKGYARSLLTRKNKYRNNMTYAQDYAVGFVEITNEDSLFMWSAEQTLRNLPEFYATILQKQYNQWLAKKYAAQEALIKAWTEGSEPLGENMLANSDFETFDNSQRPAGWNVEQHDGCKASVKAMMHEGLSGILIEPSKVNETEWHLQFNQGKLKLEAGKVYTVTFHAASPSGRQVRVGVLQSHDPWENLGLSQTIKLEKKWKQYRMTFVARQDDDNARVCFYYGKDQTSFYLANASLQPGVEYSMGADESLDQKSIALFGEVESKQRQIDRMVFLADTEKGYFDEMNRFIKDDLGCKSLVTGTIVFGPLGLYAQSDMDFVDSHAYWQHPRFPNRSWDPGDWLIDQKAMSGYPEEGTLFRMAAERLAGKPFTVSEYNHPAPLDSQAECVPMVASFAAAQDWDGVWLYTYSHTSDSWDREHMNSYFDIDSNPAKWGFMTAGATMFRDAAMSPFNRRTVAAMTTPGQDLMSMLAEFHLQIDRNLAGYLQSMFTQNMETAFYHTFQSNQKITNARTSGRLSASTNMEWNRMYNQGLYLMRNDRCCVLAGHPERFSKIQNPFVAKIKSPVLSTITMITMDGKPLTADSKKILITACGRCENTGMQFSDDRRTVGRNWGQAPVRIEPVEGVIHLRDSPLFKDKKLTCKVLNPDGTVKQIVECDNNEIPLKAEYGTMWYLVERTNLK